MGVNNRTDSTLKLYLEKLNDKAILDDLNALKGSPNVTPPTGVTEDFLSESEKREYLDYILHERSKQTAQQIVKEMMQRCIAIGQESH